MLFRAIFKFCFAYLNFCCDVNANLSPEYVYKEKSLTLMATASHDLWLVLVLATHIYLRFG